MAKKKTGGNRLIDNEKIRELVAQLHVKQLELLLLRLEDQTIEPQEMRIIWDIAKSHHIGVDSVEDLVEKAQGQIKERIEDIVTMDEAWGFTD